mgnify:CR=1 FL=1
MEEIKSEYGYFKDDKLYLKGFLDYPDRAIGEVRHDQATTLNYYLKRFEIAQRKINELENSIREAENKGSYLMKLLHLREYLGKFDGLGDYIPLFEKLDVLEEELREQISTNRVKNLEIKRELLEEGRKILALEDFRQVKEQFEEFKNNWIRTGNVVDEHQEELEQKFQEIFDQFKTRKAIVSEEKQRIFRRKLGQYDQIIQEIETLSRGKLTPEAIGEVKRLNAQWRQLPKLPPKFATKYQRNFKFISKKIFDRYNKVNRGGSSQSFNRPDRGQNQGYNRERPERPGENRRPYGDQDSRVSNRPYSSSRPDRFNRSSDDYGNQNRSERPYSTRYDATELEDNLKKKQDLLIEVKKLYYFDGNIPAAIKEVKEQWKTIGRLPRNKNKEISDEFFFQCDYLLEQYFLEETAKNRNTNYEHKDKSEKAEVKIQLLKDIMAREEKDLQDFNYSQSRGYTSDKTEDNVLIAKMAAKSRKLKAKKKLLEDLEASL